MEFLDFTGLKSYHTKLVDWINSKVNFTRSSSEAADETSNNVVYFTTDTHDIYVNGEKYGGSDVALSDEKVPFTAFNNSSCSLYLEYDGDNKIRIKVDKDLAYDLSLSVNPIYAYYGSSGTADFVVKANAYTRDKTDWSFSVGGTSTSYTSLEPGDSQSISHPYSNLTGNISGTLSRTGAQNKSATLVCRTPIIYSYNKIGDGDSFTITQSNESNVIAGYVANSVYTYKAIRPTTTQIYVALPGTPSLIKFKSGESTAGCYAKEDAKGITLSLNGQSVSYTVFECPVTSNVDFLINSFE